jgi:DNA-binding transcriptional ArsR family regulator
LSSQRVVSSAPLSSIADCHHNVLCHQLRCHQSQIVITTCCVIAKRFSISLKIYRNIAIYKYQMGTTKSDLFNKKQNETASLLKAIAHPARIAIVEYLMNVESCICGDIVNQLPLAQPTVSQHLKELKLAGVIQGSIEGNSICYCLNEKSIQKLKVYFETIETKISKQNKCC